MEQLIAAVKPRELSVEGAYQLLSACGMDAELAQQLGRSCEGQVRLSPFWPLSQRLFDR
eukprot:COSAG01_NODE_1938_length_8848_cov_17.798377_11_plen_59_part_00